MIRQTRPTSLIIGILLALMLLILPFCASLAQTKTWTDTDAPALSFSRATTFDSELPDALREALRTKNLGDYPCYSGAQHETLEMDNQVETQVSLKALVALDSGTELMLVYMEWDASGWSVVPLGAKALLPGRDFTITIADLGNTSYRRLGNRFLIEYPRPGGGTESYGIWAFRPHLPYVKTYELVDQNGIGYAILSDYPEYGFRVRPLPLEKGDELSFDPENEAFYPAYVPLWLEYMKDITDYPTTEAAAKEISATSRAQFDGTDLAMVFGDVHLRAEATSKSQSLGNIYAGTLAHVLGEKPGNDAPWYHVRVGQAEGWVSGVYIHFPTEEDFGTSMWHMPLPVAQATDTPTLRTKPDSRSEAIGELPRGTRMHVVMTVPGDWLYVMIPQGEIAWDMDIEGTCGYLRVEDVRQATSLCLLAP